ncbi:LysR family transcriptional regulator [Massilia niabensis]|uniref:LysR family transcriptional regulator n=1 Tax=Massilia niabensis TaxID=544910 RepID=A0ABW0KYU0_9BURK
MDGVLSPGKLRELDGSSMSVESTSLKSRNLRISLKQWKMFHAVIDFDGFFGAADSLHVTQSTISHAVAKLQEQLGVPLLALKGRKAQITEEGRILLERSRDLVRNAVELEELAENLRQGWGPEIRLAIDPSFPPDLLMLALRKLSSSPQRIRLAAKEVTLDQAKQALQDSTVELAISSQVPFGFDGRELIEIEHVAVAHPENPLFGLKREISFDDLKTQFQVAISGVDDYVAADANYRLPRYPRTWNVSSLDRAIGVLRQGQGYAWLPKYQVHRWLDGNHVRILPLAGGSSHKTKLHLIFGRPPAADSVAEKFAQALHSCSECFF